MYVETKYSSADVLKEGVRAYVNAFQAHLERLCPGAGVLEVAMTPARNHLLLTVVAPMLEDSHPHQLARDLYESPIIGDDTYPEISGALWEIQIPVTPLQLDRHHQLVAERWGDNVPTYILVSHLLGASTSSPAHYRGDKGPEGKIPHCPEHSNNDSSRQRLAGDRGIQFCWLCSSPWGRQNTGRRFFGLDRDSELPRRAHQKLRAVCHIISMCGLFLQAQADVVG